MSTVKITLYTRQVNLPAYAQSTPAANNLETARFRIFLGKTIHTQNLMTSAVVLRASCAQREGQTIYVQRASEKANEFPNMIRIY